MHRRVLAALLLVGLASAGQLQDAKVLGRARAINPATPKAAAAPDPPATDPAPPDAAIPDEPTEEPQPEPAKPEPTSSQSSSDSKGATSDSPSSDSTSSTSSASPDDSLTSTGPSNSSSTTAIASSSSVLTSMPRGASGPTPAAPDGDDESSSTSTNTTSTSTTDSSRTTSKTSTTTKKTTTHRPTSTSSSATPRIDDTTTKTTPKSSSTSKSRTTTRSRTRSSSAPHSSAPDQSATSTTESGTADDFLPVPTPNVSSSDVAAKEDDPVSSPSPQGPADNSKALSDSREAKSGFLHNKQATALVFTFSALFLVGLCGVIFWLCRRRRSRDRHIVLDEKDDVIAFHRANSTVSRSSRGAHRPTSMISVNSSGNTHESQGWHYMPARYAGIQPIRQQSTLDAAAGQIAQDPFAVHRVVYPDMPPPPASPTFTLYPDPVPPPPPPQRASSTRVPPPRPTSLSPDLGLAGAASSRPRSPESHYDEESVYTGTQRRPYMIERRPERRRLDE